MLIRLRLIQEPEKASGSVAPGSGSSRRQRLSSSHQNGAGAGTYHPRQQQALGNESPPPPSMMAESPPPPSSYETAEGFFAESSPEPSGGSVTRVNSGRTILLLGAPRASSLRSLPLISPNDDNNNSKFLPAFQGQISGNVDHVISTPLPAPSVTEPPAAWRILPLKRKYLHTGFSQCPDVHTPINLQLEASSMSYSSTASPTATSSTASTNEDEDLSRSFAAHNIPSSPVAGPSDLEVSFTSTNTTSSFSSLAECSAPPSSLSNIHPTALTNLRNLPTAKYLRSIIPQTMSISAIVGIIQICTRRTFTTKRFNTSLTIQPLLVGDETSAGFKLDLWLPNGKPTAASTVFMATVESLRVGDVILVQNMALGSWNNQVNGATLRKDRTRVELIYRVNCFGRKEKRRWRVVELENTSGDSGAEKVKRVVDWVRDFVGCGDKPKKRVKEGSRKVYEEGTQLPEDTQDSI